MAVELRERPLAIQPQMRSTNNYDTWPCNRCGRRNRVRDLNPNYICRDCRDADPDYVKMMK